MESFIARLCTQTAVYWGDPTDDGRGGKTFGSAYPVEIDCRWEDHVEEVAGRDGSVIVCRAVVYVTEDVEEGGYLYLGTLDDLDSGEEADPTIINDAYVIRRFDKVPALRLTSEFLRKVYL